MSQSYERKSLRKEISKYNGLALGVVLLALLFYIAINFSTIDKYGTAFTQYRHVSGFYQAMDDATGQVKDYLYTDSLASYQAYETELNKAKGHIDSLLSVDLQEGWRIQLLKNMLDSYETQVSITKTVFDANSPSYGEEYTTLLDTYELIKRTSDTYYRILTDEMEVQNHQFDQVKIYIILLSSVFAIALLGWLAFFTRTTIHYVSDPLTSILNNINKIKQGTYDLTKISSASIEMHALCEALEEMADAIQKELMMTKENAELEKRLLETENENLKKDEQLAQSEVKMLQNQINPHFLFNTLNMTYKLALAENAPKCSEMIERTSALLRYGLDKQNKMSDLMSEIKAVENYIAIQEKRLGDRVSFEIYTDPDLPNISIPGMILQPIIENSLKHGLKDCEENGEIIVSLRYIDQEVLIQISDNGEGIDEERCEAMMLNGFHDQSGEHLGLYNVVKRLEMFYQDHVDISIESALGCGFSFHIKIKVV